MVSGKLANVQEPPFPDWRSRHTHGLGKGLGGPNGAIRVKASDAA